MSVDPNPVPFLDLASASAELEPRLSEVVGRVVRSGWYLLGKETASFEQAFASFVEAHHAVGVANGLDALALALRAVGVRPGDEVIVPTNTFIATWIAVSQVGAHPIGVEPDPSSWAIDPAAIEAAISPRTRAIVPVHLYGQAAPLDDILKIAKNHGLWVVEDAAQAHGARYRGRRIGAHGDAVAWSFYPGKNLGALGDGGAVTTAHRDLAERVRTLGTYGAREKYKHDVLGQNSRLDELQAAVLQVKLARLDEWNERRRRIAAIYHEGLRDLPHFRLPRDGQGNEHVWHLFVIDHPERDRLQNHLAANHIQTLIHYPIPPHLSGAYAHLGLPAGAFPIAEAAAKTHLSLPIGPHLTLEQAKRVVHACRNFA